MAKPYGVVYCLTFPNGKLYFGATKKFGARMSLHKHSASCPKAPVSFAIKEFGWDNVERLIISECADGNELNFMEEWFIALYCPNGSGYNVQKKSRSFCVVDKMFENKPSANKGKKRTQELKDRMRRIQRDREAKGLIIPMSEEERRKSSEMNSGAKNKAYKSEEFVFIHKETGETFRGTRYDFRIKVGCNKSVSSAVALGRRSHKGWKKIEGPIQTQ